MKALVQLRRSYSIGLGVFAISLPFFILSMDTSAAAPKSPPTTVNAAEPTIALSEVDESADAKETRTRKNIKLNYVSASWVKILRDFAEATQTELVADRVPGRKYSRWDMKFYTRDEALKILNEELLTLNFRLQFKGHYLVLTELHEMRHEYSPAVLRGNHQETADSAESGVQSAVGEATDEARASRVTPRESARAKPSSKPGKASQSRAIQQVAGEGEVRNAAEVNAAPELQPPVVTTIRLKSRDAVTVSKIIYKAFKPQAELIDDGPRGLQGFLVRQPGAAEAGRQKVRDQAGDPPVRFSIGIDETKNQLVIEDTPEETKAIIRLVRALDVVPSNPQLAIRAVAITKDSGKLAAALQPELDRLSGATRKLARQTAQRSSRDDDDRNAAEQEPPRGEERLLPQRPGMRRGDGRSQLEERGPRPNIPDALSRSIKGDVKVESIPDLGVLVITGNEQDVQAVMAVIQEIERLSAGTAPEVRVAFLRHVSSEALAALLSSVYERLGQVRNATVQQSQAITVFPVSRPNAVLIVASKADMAAIYELIDELDQPSDPASEFHVFRLKNAVPSQVVDKVQALYPSQQQAQGTGQAQAQAGQVGLVPRVRIIDDLRTNSVIVQARPRDMKEVALLIADLDAPDSDSVNQVRFFQLKSAVADDVAATVSQAIQNVLAPARAVTAQAQGQGLVPGQAAAAQPGGTAGQGSAELREVKSTILKFLDEDGDELRELRSGILADIRMTADMRTNTVVVTAPEESMELVAALIKRLDKPSAYAAEIKVFKLKNGDATAMQQLLERLFGIQRTGQAGQAGAQGAQQGVPGMLLADAEDSSSMLIPLRFSVDVRTNSITAIGGAAALNVVEAVLLSLDESDIQQRKTDVYRLKNSYAPNVANAISQFLQTQRQVAQADPGLVSPFEQMEREVIVVPETTTNSLLISATPRYFKQIFDLVVKLDRMPKQVLIQALIVEVQLTNTDEWGMEVGLQDSVLFRRSPIPTPTTISSSTLTPAGTVSNQQIISESATPGYAFNGLPLGNNTFPGASNPNNLAGQLGSSFSTGLTNGSLGYGGLVLQAASENINLLLRALAARTRVDVLSRPQIRALDNQPAAIQVGQEVPRVNGFAPSGTAGVITPTVQQRSIGIILTVTPRISPDGLVVMEVVARRDSLSQQSVSLGFSAAGTTISSPIINTTNAQTVIGVNSGQTVVLGGMITKQDNVEERKVPMLGDIPILGKAFRYDFKQVLRTELLIFLTPRIINSDEEGEMFKQIEVERLNFIESEAERMHGPLFGLPPAAKAGPGRIIDEPQNPNSPQPSGRSLQSPTPPEPGIGTPSRSGNRNGLYPLPDGDGGDGPGASLMGNDEDDDDEDLDSAFIQTDYRIPQKAGGPPGRARLAKAAGSAAPVAGRRPAAVNGSSATKQSQGKNRPSKTRRTDADES